MNWMQTKLAPVLMAAAMTVPVVTTVHAAEAEQQQLSRAKLEVQLKAGKSTIKFDVKTLDLGEKGTFKIASDEHEYEVTARVEDAGDGKRVNVMLGLKRDDEEIISGAQLKIALGGKGTQSAGKSRLEVKVTRGEPKAHRIDMPEGDDPLSGL